MTPRKPRNRTGALLPVPMPPSGGSGALVATEHILVETFFRDKDPKTVRAYRSHLEDFRRWIEVRLKVGRTLTQNEAAIAFLGGGQGQANLLALEWKDHLKSEKYAPHSVNGHLTALRSLVKVARLLGLVPWALDVDNVAAEVYRDTAGPGSDRFGRVMAELESRRDPVGVRDRALLAMLHDAGLRRNEAHTLDLEHLDWTNRRAWVQAKKRAERVPVSFSSEVERHLRAWIEVRGKEPGSLFKNFDPQRKGDRLSGTGIYRVSQKYGLGQPHGLRHLAITEALAITNGNVAEVMKFSRHKDPKVVMIYDDNRKNVSGEISQKIADLRKRPDATH